MTKLEYKLNTEVQYGYKNVMYMQKNNKYSDKIYGENKTGVQKISCHLGPSNFISYTTANKQICKMNHCALFKNLSHNHNKNIIPPMQVNI